MRTTATSAAVKRILLSVFAFGLITAAALAVTAAPASADSPPAAEATEKADTEDRSPPGGFLGAIFFHSIGIIGVVAIGGAALFLGVFLLVPLVCGMIEFAADCASED